MSQIKSKQRVKDNGEVFTRKQEVKDMMSLIWENKKIPIDEKILEPCCGDGNFLIEVLKWKLRSIKDIKDQADYERASAKTISNIYAIEYLKDNREEAIIRLYQFFERYYKMRFKDHNKEFLRFILSVLIWNIKWGDSMMYKGFGKYKQLIFSDYIFKNDTFRLVYYDYSQFGYKIKNGKQIKKYDSPKPKLLKRGKERQFR